MSTMSLGKALNSGLRRAMEHDPKVVLMGEDIGKLGGVFRVTEGLQAKYGKSRCFDAPINESGIVGAAVGMAGNSSLSLWMRSIRICASRLPTRRWRPSSICLPAMSNSGSHS